MTARRQRMLEGLQLRGVSARTQARDVRAVRRLAEHAHQVPRREHRGSTPPGVPGPHACQAVRSERQHDGTVRPHVRLRVHPPPRLDSPQLCARPTREQTASALEPRSGANAARPWAPGGLPAQTAWSTSPPGRDASARRSARPDNRPPCARSSRPTSGIRTGSCPARPSAVARPPSETWPRPACAWPSATPVSSRGKRATARCRTRTRPRLRSPPRRCLPRRSGAGCCRTPVPPPTAA